MATTKHDQVTIPYNFTPRPYQLELFRAMDGIQGRESTKKKRAILRWHRRAGKDKACWCYLIKEAARVAGNYFYVFPTKENARKSLWENIDREGFPLLDHIPEEFIARKSTQESLIQLINGSTIRLIGLDKDINAIRGAACKGVVFSEFSFADPEGYKVMVPMIRESGGWAIINSTPNGRNHFYDMWKQVENSPNWHVSYLQTYWPSRENYTGLTLPDELELVRTEDGYDEEEIEREYGCSFSTGMKGSFYINSIEKAHDTGRVGDFLYDDTFRVDTFWDLGIDDSTAVWFRQTRGNSAVFIDYYENNGKDLQHYVNMLESKGYRYGIHYLPHDAGHRSLHTGVSTDTLFTDLCRNYNISDDVIVLDRTSVQNGINSVRARFSKYCFDVTRCHEGLKKLELYHRRYDKRRQVFMKEPAHDSNSHAADAMRMEAISGDNSQDAFFKINNLSTTTDYDPFDF